MGSPFLVWNLLIYLLTGLSFDKCLHCWMLKSDIYIYSPKGGRSIPRLMLCTLVGSRWCVLTTLSFSCVLWSASLTHILCDTEPWVLHINLDTVPLQSSVTLKLDLHLSCYTELNHEVDKSTHQFKPINLYKCPSYAASNSLVYSY